MRRVDLMHAHGSPTRYLYDHFSCRCVFCVCQQHEYHAAYRAAHREEKNAYAAAYHAAHREKRAAYASAYRVSHLDKELARHAAYRAAHREEMHAYYVAHQEERLAYHAAYRAKHYEELRAQGFARRAELREEIAAIKRAWAPDGCLVCGRMDLRGIDAHHRDPTEKESGVARIHNLDKLREELVKCVPLCGYCHQVLHAMLRNGSKGMDTEAVVELMKRDLVALVVAATNDNAW